MSEKPADIGAKRKRVIDLYPPQVEIFKGMDFKQRTLMTDELGKAIRILKASKPARTVGSLVIEKLVMVAMDERGPPKIAEFLLTALLKPAHADAVTGDLNERFTRECDDLGRRRAVWRYWARSLHSLWPLLRRAIGKALKWGAVIDAVRRHW